MHNNTVAVVDKPAQNGYSGSKYLTLEPAIQHSQGHNTTGNHSTTNAKPTSFLGKQ